MDNCAKNAICNVRNYAKAKIEEDRNFVKNICDLYEVDIQELVNRVIANPVTINFHLDRFSANGKTIIENLIEDGKYHGQFRTGTTNGGKSAYIGGDRFLWEQRIFSNAYSDEQLDRPKYGALNILRYLDGASVRFGACFLTLKPEIVQRCTFAYGDSSTNPTTLCTSDTFEVVLAEMLRAVQKNGQLLNKVVSWEQEVLAVLMNPSKNIKDMGRNLDHCIETHIHGDILLDCDVDSLFIDESYRKTIFQEQAEELCGKYGINLRWIPERQVDISSMDKLFRGSIIPRLAQKIDFELGNSLGIINALLMGQASRDIAINPERWAGIGNEMELFQYIKQLWHTAAFFG